MTDIRVGIGHDRHPFSKAGHGPLALGCVNVEFERRLIGHSDGDAVAHCIADALLSAAGQPDLGTTFPEACSATAGIAGSEILKWTARLVSDAGWRIGNIDCVVVCDHPTLGPRVPEMCASVAGALGIEPDRVKVKPRHAEGLGFAGRDLGIESTAVVLLYRD
jgi:2-C-methyl-D-erythritol 2,4-cyclodiphosphate synthase